MANGETSFGYLLPTREVVMAPGNPDFASLIDLAETAEGHGFDSVWCGDSVLARPRLEALSTLAAIAGRTQKVKLGTAVFLPALRNPVILANEVANLDIISNGRVILGVGIAGRGAGELIAEGALAVEIGARLDDLRLTIHPHPTLSETLMEAAEVFFGLSPHYLGKRR